MTSLTVAELQGIPVVSQDGRELGEVESFVIDIDTWRVEKVEIKVRKRVLEELNLRRPLLGTQVIQVRAEEISGVSDTLVLKSDLSELTFDGGEAEEPVTMPPEREAAKPGTP
jgi:sporulation protein YlmC with PRC-barrel domain